MTIENKFEVRRNEFLDLDFLKEGDILDIENEKMELITYIFRNRICTAKELDGNIYEISYKIKNGAVYINDQQPKIKISENNNDSYLFYYCKLINAGLMN